MADLAFVAVLGLISAGIGSLLLSVLKQHDLRPGDRLSQAIPLGLGSLALATLAFGELGQLRRTNLLALLAGAAIMGVWPGTLLVFQGASRDAVARVGRALLRGTVIDRALIGFVVLALFGSGLAALAPVTDGDALCYHLQAPKVFLARGAVTFEPDLHETVYPLITELLYVLALEFRGPTACRCVHFLLGLCFAGNVTLLARPYLRSRAWWAGAIALLVPAISNGMSAPLNDVALAAFGTAAIAAALRAFDRPRLAYAALAGIFAGLALGVKYPALVLFGLLSIVFSARPVLLWLGWVKWGWETLPDPAARTRIGARLIFSSLMLTVVFMASAVAVGGCWYLRAYWNTGNPVFPYYRHVFGGAGLDEVLDPTRRALTVTPWNVLTAIVPMTLHPDRFESFSHQLGPIFLLFLPALWLERAPRRVLGLVVLGYAFLMICVTQRQSMRFVLLSLGPMSVGVAYLARRWVARRSVSAACIITALILALGLESAQALARCRTGLGVVLGRETAEEFLSRREPTYRVGGWIAGNLPTSARLIGQDHRGFYLPRDYTMELAHRRRTSLGRHGESPDEIVEHLTTEGFTHLLLCPPIPETAVEFDPTLGRLLGPWLSARTPIYRRELADGDGIVRRYAIYELSERSGVADFDAASDFERIAALNINMDANIKMNRPTLAELRCRAQKGRHREIGNVLARSFGRPAAIYGSWLAVRLGLSAHQVTSAALAVSLGAAIAIGSGDRLWFVAGVTLLYVAFWLDHVDGQVARWRGTASLDGVYFDYLLHHAATSALGFALGFGLAMRHGRTSWTLAGFSIALGWGLLSLHNDCRYKAFFQRLKGGKGSFRVDGGSADRPSPPARWPRRGLGLLTWPAYKACESHVVLMGLSGLAILALFAPSAWAIGWQAATILMAIAAPALGALRIARSISRRSTEEEFARWFRPASSNDDR